MSRTDLSREGLEGHVIPAHAACGGARSGMGNAVGGIDLPSRGAALSDYQIR